MLAEVVIAYHRTRSIVLWRQLAGTWRFQPGHWFRSFNAYHRPDICRPWYIHA